MGGECVRACVRNDDGFHRASSRPSNRSIPPSEKRREISLFLTLILQLGRDGEGKEGEGGERREKGALTLESTCDAMRKR